MDAGRVRIRRMTDADVPAARAVSWDALVDAGTRYGWTMPPLDEGLRARGEAQFRHLRTTDPDGLVVADRDGELVGVAMATRRGPLWFVSLLTVAPSLQAQGLGRRLLDTVSATRGDLAALCASDDPKALRRYRRAGFDLHPGYEAKGALDRGVLPAGTSLRDGSYDDDRDLVESVATACRGAGHGPDLDWWAACGRRLLVTDGPEGRGYVVCGEAGPVVLGASAPAVAARLLWGALAEATADDMDVSWVTAGQQWALDVVLAARLALRPAGSVCRSGVGPSGAPPPWAPYLPSGSLG
jgi:GNAT superfamily N-acetyltransferase